MKAPAHERLNGWLLRFEETPESAVLIQDEEMLAGRETLPGKVLVRGEIELRYAFALVYLPAERLIPERVFDDFRREYRGVDALRFMLAKGDTYPRADVTGYRASSGRYEEYFMREVDLAREVRVAACLAGADELVWVGAAISFWPAEPPIEPALLLPEIMPVTSITSGDVPRLRGEIAVRLRHG
ncbi:MAG: hypothetical protein IT326_05075 [Anaerolineae bacterium]|nr:hypothetical protein [Anaerolineae bacterium]